jgi:hypothetical protein
MDMYAPSAVEASLAMVSTTDCRQTNQTPANVVVSHRTLLAALRMQAQQALMIKNRAISELQSRVQQLESQGSPTPCRAPSLPDPAHTPSSGTSAELPSPQLSASRKLSASLMLRVQDLTAALAAREDELEGAKRTMGTLRARMAVLEEEARGSAAAVPLLKQEVEAKEHRIAEVAAIHGLGAPASVWARGWP